MTVHNRLVSSFLLTGLLPLACSGAEDAPQGNVPDTLVVYSFSRPVGHLVDRLVGDAVKHDCILPEDVDAATWKPGTDLIVELQQADLLFSNGLGFEGWVKTAALPSSKLIEAAKGIEPIRMEGKTHSHGKGGAHSHGEIDPHAWSDPMNYLEMANVVATAIVKSDASLKTTVEQNLSTLSEELKALSTDNATIMAGLKGVSLAANHPSFSYLMQSQGLSIENFDLDPEGAFEESEVAKLKTWLEVHPTSALLWEAEPSKTATAALPNVQHFFIDPLEGPVDGQYDYVAQAKANQERYRNIAFIAQQYSKPVDAQTP